MLQFQFDPIIRRGIQVITRTSRILLIVTSTPNRHWELQIPGTAVIQVCSFLE